MNKGVTSQVVCVLGILLFSSSQILLEDVAVSAAPGDPDRDSTLFVSGSHIIEDHQVWGAVMVRSGSRLVVANGGHLETGHLELEGRSTLEVRAGVITVENHTYSPLVGITGECDRLIVTHRSVVTVRGTDGVYDVDHSAGGDAVIDLVVRVTLRIETSTVHISGGAGLSPPWPMTSGDLGGDAFTGGDAVLDLEVTDDDPTVSLRNSRVNLTGGDGGDAPDGMSPPSPDEGGRGGGFTRGGMVTGTVARGGDAQVVLNGRDVDVTNVQFSLRGGGGGDAGDGGPVAPGDRAGGGGGGYSGGDGAHASAWPPAMDGGVVSGHVGEGGDARFRTRGRVHNLSGCMVDARGGDGGDAGDGGASRGAGGGGGGGYSGGGGGAQGRADGGDGGQVAVSVGRGGDAAVRFYTDEHLDIRSTGVFATGGDGGDAGNGGGASSTGGGGGGGSSGGGGGARGDPGGTGEGTDGGQGGPVGGLTSHGGTAEMEMSTLYLVFLGGASRAQGGGGGDEGEAGLHPPGSDTGTLGGTGGGGRSSGGGAGRGLAIAGDGSPGAAATVDHGVGRGGDSDDRFTASMATISADTAIASVPGAGGEVLDRVPGGPLDGHSVSGEGLPGSRSIHIPMSQTILRLPNHESSIYQLPAFQWVDVHSSTQFGIVVSYIVVVDDDEDFSSPERLLEVDTNMAKVEGLSFGVHHWYVRAVYQGTVRTMGPESFPSWFSFYNAPPRFHIVEPEGVYERRVTKVDLARYILDPDTPFENLTLSSADERVLATEGVTMTLYFEEPSALEWIPFSISDGHSTKWFNLPVVVLDVNDPPVFVSIGGQEVPATLVVKEGDLAYFDIVAEDRDGEALTFTLLTTWQDIRLVGDDTLRVWARPGMLGERSAKLLVEDPRHAVTSTRFVIRVTNTPDPPEGIEVFGPKDLSTHRQLDPVTFTVKVSDPDLVWGEEVNVTWESDISGHLATRRCAGLATFTTASLPLGAHIITVTVSDGHFERTESFHITIVERPDPPDLPEPEEEGVPPLAILLLVIMPMLGYYLGRKGVGYARR